MTEKEILGPREFYDGMAAHYENFIEQTRFNILSLEEERIFVESFIDDKKTILDLGCGTGRTMKLISNTGRELIGVDISSKMLEIARDDGLDVVQASALNLPFTNSYFDVIYSLHMGFGYCKDNNEVEKLALELFRVLKEGGMIMLDTPHGKVRGERYIISWPAGDRTINAIGYGKTKDEISKTLKRAGFRQPRFFGGYKKYEELQSESRRIIVLAIKG
jgi:ubiquinone/menaquinone biosynthesis C-methylase UbiE